MKYILKEHGNLIIMLIMILTFSACEKHDFIDEEAITGNVGPQAYWEIESSTVSAGSTMPFVLQYYTTSEDIDYSEVWYSLTETQEKAVSCPWVTTFTYSISSTKSEEKRIYQKIQEYPHSLAVWSDSIHAYTFEAEFPVSGTLAPLSWVKPETFDSQKMELYFGEDFMPHFKDSLYNLMKFADFKNMILGMSLLEDFGQYTDSTYDNIATINSGSPDSIFVYHFPGGSLENDGPVPTEIKTLYDGITFDQLIAGAANYNVEYKRTYYINAIMRVYDKKGVYGTTVSKKIDIN